MLSALNSAEKTDRVRHALLVPHLKGAPVFQSFSTWRITSQILPKRSKLKEYFYKQVILFFRRSGAWTLFTSNGKTII